MVTTLDEALRILKNAVRKKENVSVGLVGNCADIIPELAERGVVPDILTTRLRRMIAERICAEWDDAGGGAGLRARDPKAYQERSLDAMAKHVEGMLRLQKMGSITFDYATTSVHSPPARREECLRLSGIRSSLHSPPVCEGRGPFRWVRALGEASDIAITDDLVLELFPENRSLRRWIELARKRIKFQGLPARICWLGYGERARFGLAINDLVKKG